MCRSCFETFIRSGGNASFVVNLSGRPAFEIKQTDIQSLEAVRVLVNGAWDTIFAATTADILRAEPFEFSADGLAGINVATLRDDATTYLANAVKREGLDLSSSDDRHRALEVLSGFLNATQQAALQIQFYIWVTLQDPRVRATHAIRSAKAFRWDTPPEGGHPSQDFGCRCYAKAMSINGYWARVSNSVATFVADLEEWEGNVDHMYLDTRGYVTVGKGKLLPTSNSAVALPFKQRGTDDLATQEEIRTEYDMIAGLDASQSRGAGYYEQFTQLILSQDDIDRMVLEHIRGDFEDLLVQFPDFGNFPLPAQIALLDMLYNLGPAGLAKFGRLKNAIIDGDWEEAARQSNRIGPSKARNDYVFDLFMQAATD